VAWLLNWLLMFAVKGFWALWDNIYECKFVMTVAMVMLLRDDYVCLLLTTLALPVITGSLLAYYYSINRLGSMKAL
jgi:hypothetical protein